MFDRCQGIGDPTSDGNVTMITVSTVSLQNSSTTIESGRMVLEVHVLQSEVGAFYWTVLAPDIVNPGREEQGSVSV